ncbi:MAG: hypothetical protein MZW92_44445 [Comamonadaceae bacterium]|nr:hypothetical protein [Comamonadaceae bacterium]
MRRIEAALKSGSLLAVVPPFALLGLLPSFTPCVLPMLPILSSIIAGDRASRRRSKARALPHGGEPTRSAWRWCTPGSASRPASPARVWPPTLQRRAVLATFGALLVLLALSMFGFYELQLPACAAQRAWPTLSQRCNARPVTPACSA